MLWFLSLFFKFTAHSLSFLYPTYFFYLCFFFSFYSLSFFIDLWLTKCSWAVATSPHHLLWCCCWNWSHSAVPAAWQPLATAQLLPLDWCLAWSHHTMLKQELQCLGCLQGLPADLSWDGLYVRLLWFMLLSYPEWVSNFPFWYLLKNGGVLHHLPYFSPRNSLHQLVAV